jgi:putative flippase GtrA
MTAIVTDPRERGRFLRFAVVGVIGAVVDFGIANLLDHGLGAPLVVAGTISFLCAVISNFVWNRYWTYPDSRTKPLSRQFYQFSVVSILGLGSRVPLLAFLEKPIFRLISSLPFRIPFFSIEFLSANITLAIAVLVVMLWNFFVNRYWTYNDVD